MTFHVKSIAATSPHTPLVPHDLERRTVLPDDVVLDILYCGICHSDVHLANNDWQSTHYPLVPGHEIVGKVSEVGKSVNKFKVGDVGAVGCIVDSCSECSMCKSDLEMFCQKGMTLSLNSDEGERFPGHFTGGGFSQKIVVRESMVLHVPEKLQDPKLLPGVAPILCSGITSYSPLRQFDVKKGSKVAILGMGGLGNIGVRLARALGADVTVVSRSHSKDDAAKASGASHIVASSSKEEMDQAASQFDLILDTIPSDHDLNSYIPLLKPFGTICIVGQLGPLSTPLNTVPAIFGNRRIAFSAIGGIKETQELLDLCAEKGITADHEVIKTTEVNDVWKKISDGTTSQRFVIDTNTF